MKNVERFIVIRNFDKFQHYKDRNPPWIRLYFALLNDREFYRLPDAQKFHVVGLFLIASQYDNKIPLDMPWITRQLAASEEINLETLVASRFIEILEQPASKPLAKRKRVDVPETETETETENVQNTEPPVVPQGGPIEPEPKPRILYEIWEQEHGGLPAFPHYTEGIRRKCESRMNSHSRDPAKFVDDFRAAIVKARETPFLCGGGEKGWKADIHWFLKNDDNYRKVLSGKYDGARKSKSQNRAEQRNQAAKSALSDYLAEDTCGNMPYSGGRGTDGTENQVVHPPPIGP